MPINVWTKYILIKYCMVPSIKLRKFSQGLRFHDLKSSRYLFLSLKALMQVFGMKRFFIRHAMPCCFESRRWWLFEPRHDKTNKVTVRPAITQISLGISPVWSESSLSAWRQFGSLAIQWAHSEDSDQTHFVGFVVSRLIFFSNLWLAICKAYLAVSFKKLRVRTKEIKL